MKPKITAWSYSRYSVYQKCPRQAYYKFIEKRKEPQGAALARGEQIHIKIEGYLSRGGRIPKEAEQLKDEYKILRKQGPIVEMEVAYTQRWDPCDWFSPTAWCRVKIDAIVPPNADDDLPIVKIIDHKTGKLGDEYDEQLELYGLAGLISFPLAAASTASLYFVDQGCVVHYDGNPGYRFLREDLSKMKKLWESRTKKMLSDTRFDPKPGNACRWCHFRKSNGGPCEY